MDLSYATILIFSDQRTLYRENHFAYMINNKENPKKHPIYFVDTDMGSSSLFNNSCPQKSELGPSKSASDEPNQ